MAYLVKNCMKILVHYKESIMIHLDKEWKGKTIEQKNAKFDLLFNTKSLSEETFTQANYLKFYDECFKLENRGRVQKKKPSNHNLTHRMFDRACKIIAHRLNTNHTEAKPLAKKSKKNHEIDQLKK